MHEMKEVQQPDAEAAKDTQRAQKETGRQEGGGMSFFIFLSFFLASSAYSLRPLRQAVWFSPAIEQGRAG
jgi:hypothetical protein